MPSSAPQPRVGRRLGTLALLGALAVSLLVAVPALRPVGRDLRGVGLIWIAVALALELASCLSFVVLFRLFFDRLSPREARALAWTEMSSGALLPGGGAGGVAIGAWLISLTGAPRDWIIRRSSGLFFLTTGVNGVAIIGSALVLLTGVGGEHRLLLVLGPLALAATATVLIAELPWAASHRRAAMPAWLAAVVAGIADARRTATRPRWRLLGAPGYLFFDIAVLWTTLSAVGRPPSPPELILAYVIGYLANALPIPAGIGVLDAGLTGALVLYGVSPAHALTAVLLYHAIAFWLPALGGLVAYLRVRTRLLAPAAAAAPLIDSPTSLPRRGSHDRRHPDHLHRSDPQRVDGSSLRRPRARPLPRPRRQAACPALPVGDRPRMIGRHPAGGPGPRIRTRRPRTQRRADHP